MVHRRADVIICSACSANKLKRVSPGGTEVQTVACCTNSMWQASSSRPQQPLLHALACRRAQAAMQHWQSLVCQRYARCPVLKMTNERENLDQHRAIADELWSHCRLCTQLGDAMPVKHVCRDGPEESLTPPNPLVSAMA